ncbi:MAG: hypothetical protein JXB48_19980 [Candidatus Latescibacteria bacterium]|nr:hypothetical protein [Candidatus Latescibacterota bacterium]
MSRITLFVFLGFSIFTVWGRDLLEPDLHDKYVCSSSDLNRPFYLDVLNNNPFDVVLTYGTGDFKFVVDDPSTGPRMLEWDEINWTSATTKDITFTPGYNNDVAILPMNNIPFSAKVSLDGAEDKESPCYSIDLLSISVINNCDGTHTAIFSYNDTHDGGMTLPRPSNPDNQYYNYFTDYKNDRINSTSQPEYFNGTGSFSITFEGAYIIWHLAGATWKASAGEATNVCPGGCLSESVPMDDYYYRPYPVLTVHGYNATPNSWGAVTGKGEDRDVVKVATKIESFNDERSALMSRLVDGIHSTGTPYNDFKPTDAHWYWGSRDAQKYFPYEEDESYTDINHTYVESYCSNYGFESDDAFNAKATSPYNGGTCSDNANKCYKLTAFQQRVAKIYGSPYGGQTQLIRMRIVQLLNEYYGDWKWLHDPTAKIDIVAHSNGGLIVTAALANDEHFYNAGISKGDPAEEYYLNGLGVRLSDHVNQVQTVDTPFDGSPLSESDAGILNHYSGWQALAMHLLIESLQPVTTLLLAYEIPGVITYILLNPTLSFIINEVLVQELFVRTGTALNKSMAPGSPFLTAVKAGGVAPAYSPQSNYQYYSFDPSKKIPYINYVGIVEDFGTLSAIGTGIGAGALTFFLVRCFVGGCNPVAVYSSGCATAFFAMISAWAYNSDLIVSKNSQKMSTIYNDLDPERYLVRESYHPWFHTFHSNMPKTKTDEIIQRINSKPDLRITHAIGENQIASVDEDDITEFQPQEFVTEDAVLPNNCVTLHPIAHFNGMDNADPTLKWPAKDPYHDVIKMNVTTGKAVKIVGYIKNAYMNQVAMYVLVNNEAKYDMVFNTHFGKWASRSIDRDGDKIITNEDWPGGSWFFTPDLSCDIEEGENDIKIVSKALHPDTYPASLCNKDSLVASVKVICGKPLRVFEADASGLQKEHSFFNMPMRWDITGGEEKYVVFGITDPITRSTNPGDPDGIHIKAGEKVPCDPPNEIHLNEVTSCGILDPGEFCIEENPSMAGHAFGGFELSSYQLKKVAGEVTIDQLVHFRFIDAGEGTWSNANIPFYVDNEPVQIRLFLPYQKGDYNGDGIVDADDNCVITNNLGPSPNCSDVCTQAGIDPSSQECSDAIAECNANIGTISVINRPECDGIDNDLDGAVDVDDDISEMTNIEYYSPQYDDDDNLTTKPVLLSFSITDNLQHIFRNPKKLQIKVYKVAGNEHTVSDELLFVDNYLKDSNNDPVTFGDITYIWPFTVNQGSIPPFTEGNPPPDGLYCMVVCGLDLAGIEGGGDEITSAPGYFIVDRTPPSFTILKEWYDDKTGQPVLNRNTERFLMYYRPGPAGLAGPFSDRFDSETFELEVIFHAEYAKNERYANVSAGYQRISSLPSYQNIYDNLKYINNESGLDVPDLVIDPTTCEIKANQTWRMKWWERLWFKPDLPNGKYTVEYIAKDKAGNVTTVHDPDFFITVERDKEHIPVFVDGSMKVDGSTEWDEDHPNQGTKTTENTEDDGDLTRDVGNISSIPIDGATPVTGSVAEMTIRVDALNNTGEEAQIGLTVRNSTNDNDVMAEIVVNNDGNVAFITRTTAGEEKTVIAEVSAGMVSGIYIRIHRDASGVVTGSYSTDNGTTFTTVGSGTIGTQDVLIGIIHRQIGSPENPPGTSSFTVINDYTDTWIPIQPILENVVNNCDGTYTAHFGYNNTNSVEVVLQHGPDNYFTYKSSTLDVLYRASRFAVGRQYDVFTVDFDGSALTWNLNGLSVTANAVPAGCEPVIVPGSISGYAVYGFNRVDLADRSELICGSGKCAMASGAGSGVTIGVQSRVKSIESRGPVFLRNYANCSDFIKSTGTVTLQDGASCPSISQNYNFPADVLPSTLSTSNIDFTGVPQTDRFVESYQTKTLTPGTYWNYTCRENGKLKLGAGTYYFHNLHMENNSIIECNVSSGSVKVFVQNYYYSGATCNLIGGDASKVLYGYLGTNTVTVDKLKGTLVAPNATIEAGGWAPTFYGQLIGKEVVARPDFKLYYLPFSQ